MNKRRILYVSEADIFGGAERYLLMVLEGLDRERYDPTVALHPEAPRQLVEELEALKVPLCSIIPIRGKRDFFSLIMQRVLFKDKKPDIVHFNISNPYQGQYTMLAARMAREKEVVFTGWLKDIPTVLSFFDLFVLPSLYESFPFAVLEAMAAQKAVITTRVDGIEEVVEEGGTGLLVSPRDPGALSEGIVALLKDRERAVEMGVRGRRMLETNFTAEQMQRKTGQLYEECLSKTGW